MAMMKAHKGKIRVQSYQTDSAGGGIAKPQLKETTVPPSTLHRAADGGSAAVVGEGGERSWVWGQQERWSGTTEVGDVLQDTCLYCRDTGMSNEQCQNCEAEKSELSQSYRTVAAVAIVRPVNKMTQCQQHWPQPCSWLSVWRTLADRTPCITTLTTPNFFTGWMPFPLPNQ